MGELEEKLGAILSNQDAMSQIMALAKSLGGTGAGAAPPAAPPPEPPGDTSPPALPSAGGGIDPRLFSMAAKLAGAYNDANDDRRVALLTALGPFVKEERRAKLNKAIQIARLTRVVRIALESFRTKGEGHV